MSMSKKTVIIDLKGRKVRGLDLTTKFIRKVKLKVRDLSEEEK